MGVGAFNHRMDPSVVMACPASRRGYRSTKVGEHMIQGQSLLATRPASPGRRYRAQSLIPAIRPAFSASVRNH